MKEGEAKQNQGGRPNCQSGACLIVLIGPVPAEVCTLAVGAMGHRARLKMRNSVQFWTWPCSYVAHVGHGICREYRASYLGVPAEFDVFCYSVQRRHPTPARPSSMGYPLQHFRCIYGRTHMMELQSNDSTLPRHPCFPEGGVLVDVRRERSFYFTLACRVQS